MAQPTADLPRGPSLNLYRGAETRAENTKKFTQQTRNTVILPRKGTKSADIIPRCRCDNELYGCNVVVKLDILTVHLRDCEHNPKKPVPCSQGCGLTVPKDEMVRNNDILQSQQCSVISCSGGAQLCEGTEAAGEGSRRNNLQSTTRHDGYEVRGRRL